MKFFQFFLTFFIFVEIAIFIPHFSYIYNICRACTREKLTDGAFPVRYFLQFFTCSRYRFCSFLSIFCFARPWKSTSRPCSPALFRRRNRDTLPYPYILSPARRISFRKLCICTVKKAFFPPQKDITFLLYSLLDGLASNFTDLSLTRIELERF